MSAPLDDDDVLLVLAHGLLRAMRDIEGALDVLLSRGDDLPSDVRTRTLHLLSERSLLVSGVLGDLLRGSDPEVIAQLDGLGARAPVRS